MTRALPQALHGGSVGGSHDEEALVSGWDAGPGCVVAPVDFVEQVFRVGLIGEPDDAPSESRAGEASAVGARITSQLTS